MRRWFLALGALCVLTVLGAVALAANIDSAAAQTPPALQITGPSNGATVASPVTISVNVTGVTIKAASEADPNSSHLHYFVDKDPAGIIGQGQTIPSGDPAIIHSGSTALALPALAPGQHTVWVVLGHLDHSPYNPSVQAQVSFTVGNQATPAAATAAAPAAASTSSTPPAPNALPVAGTGTPRTSSQVELLLAGAAVTAALLALAGFRLSRGAGRS